MFGTVNVIIWNPVDIKTQNDASSNKFRNGRFTIIRTYPKYEGETFRIILISPIWT